MPRRNTNISDPFVPVKLVPLTTPDGSPSSRNAVMIAENGVDTEVGVVSTGYQLVTNEDVSNIALDVLGRTGLYFDDAGMIFDGKRYRQRWVLPDLEMEVRPGDLVHVTMDVINSYDASTLFGLSFNARRLICKNGLMIDYMLGGFRFKHWGHDGFVEELQLASNRVHSVAENLGPLTRTMKRMTETPVDRAFIQNTFTTLNLPKSLQAEAFMSIEEDNVWGLYNGLTDVLTRQETHHADNVNRQVTRHLLAA